MARKDKIQIKRLSEHSLDIIPLLVDLSNGNVFKDAEHPTTSEKISLIAQYTGESWSNISRWTFRSISNTAQMIIDTLVGYEYKEPPRTLEIDGKVYDLILEPQKQSGGWWHHFEQITAHTDAVSFLGLAYMERGLVYATLDESKNVINPTDKRGEAIATKYNAAMFLDLMGFFLKKYEGASILTLIHDNPEMMLIVKKMGARTIGKTLST